MSLEQKRAPDFCQSLELFCLAVDTYAPDHKKYLQKGNDI
jgi:hypothetical protein